MVRLLVVVLYIYELVAIGNWYYGGMGEMVAYALGLWVGVIGWW